MLKILWKRGEIAPLFQNIFYLLLDFRGTRYSLRDEWLFKISEFEITRVNCIFNFRSKTTYSFVKCGSSNYFFFNSAILIHFCNSDTLYVEVWSIDISKYFRESLGLRDNESRL